MNHHRKETTKLQERQLSLVLSPPPNSSTSLPRGAPSKSPSKESSQSGFPLFPHQRIQDRLEAVVSDDDGNKTRSRPILTKPSQPKAPDLSFDSGNSRERELSCVSFASREPENSSFLKYLSSIHFRPRYSEPQYASSPQKGADVSDRNRHQLNAQPVNNAVRKTNEDVTLLSFFENEDDDSVKDLCADDGENVQSLLHPTAVGRKSNHLKKLLGKYSESISCIIPNFSSVTPSTSPSREQRPLEEYKPHFRDDEDEIEVTFAPEPSEKTLNDYTFLLQDPAYLHAQQAGFLWQSLVGQHVRFPYHWWNGLRGPPMSRRGNPEDESYPWYHVGSCAVQNHKALQRIVRNRASPGRVLLHVLVRDALSGDIICDLAVGCYHPNARGIRMTQKADPMKKTTRHVWMAFRNRTRWSVAVIEQWIKSEVQCRSPIGKCPITNGNILFVYGENPPLETLYLSENSLSELHGRANKFYPLPLMLCDSFVFH